MIFNPVSLSFSSIAWPSGLHVGSKISGCSFSRSYSADAGVQAAQLIISKDVVALITGSIGSKAFSMLTSKGVNVLPFIKGSVADALRAYRENALEKFETPNSPAAHRQREKNHMCWKPRERTSTEDNHSGR